MGIITTPEVSMELFITSKNILMCGLLAVAPVRMIGACAAQLHENIHSYSLFSVYFLFFGKKFKVWHIYRIASELIMLT
jgi:hypothetical protein